MRKAYLGSAALLLALATMASAQAVQAKAKIDYSKITPLQLVKQTPRGDLHNPYKDTNKKVVKEGQHQFLAHGCNGCHGGGGGGGMCPPLVNTVWVYGGDDDTLFRQVTLGSVIQQKDGYHRIGSENVVGPMPPFGALFKNSKELWEVITFIRSQYAGDPGNKYGQQEAVQFAAEFPKDKAAQAAAKADGGSGGDTIHSVPLD